MGSGGVRDLCCSRTMQKPRSDVTSHVHVWGVHTVVDYDTAVRLRQSEAGNETQSHLSGRKNALEQAMASALALWWPHRARIGASRPRRAFRRVGRFGGTTRETPQRSDAETRWHALALLLRYVPQVACAVGGWTEAVGARLL